MRMQKVPLTKISYEYKEYSKELYDSILRIGFSFPVTVSLNNHKYICIDGHKRLSVLQDILNNYPEYHRGSTVCIVVKEDMRSNDCWRRINIH